MLQVDYEIMLSLGDFFPQCWSEQGEKPWLSGSFALGTSGSSSVNKTEHFNDVVTCLDIQCHLMDILFFAVSNKLPPTIEQREFAGLPQALNVF